MKKVIAMLGVALMTGLTLISCKKDDDTRYPAAITASVWSGTNASTGYSCDVIFTDPASMPGSNSCVITVSGPDKTKTNVFQGPFTYDADKGLVTVQLPSLAGGADKALLQFNAKGTTLAVSFTSASSVDYGTYTVSKVTYPKSIAGNWVSTDLDGIAVTAYLAPYAIDGGVPCTVSVVMGQTTMNLEGFYTYVVATGKGEFDVIMNGQSLKGTFTYNADGSLTCAVPTMSINAKLVRATKL